MEGRQAVEVSIPAVEQVELSLTEQSSFTEGREIPGLKPADGGRSAWQVLMAAFVLEALFWGFPNAFGIFQAYYSDIPRFEPDRSQIPTIGTLGQGIVCLGAPLSTALVKRYPQHRVHLVWLGWGLAILGLLTASFANSIPELIVTQGLIYGVGFVVLFFPILSMLNEWWIARKGMAFGIISSASGLTGVIMPFVIEALLHRFGYKITLRACAIAMVLTAPLIPLLKGRLPHSERSEQPKTNWSFVYQPLFWVYAAAYFSQGLGFYFPLTFLPSYALSLGMSSAQSALLLAVMALSQTLGQFTFGWLSDTKLHVSFLAAICCVVTSIATAMLWGLGKSLPMLMIYSILYGFFAFGFSTMRTAMGRAVSSDQSAMMAMFSSFVFLQGIGTVLIGPISAGLIKGEVDVAKYGAETYMDIILFVAATAIIGAFIIALPHISSLYHKIR